jgi:hypothetical protein
MADDNFFDQSFGAFGDQNPPGTMTPMGGISPDDPLIDWGSNMKPSDLAQYIHDPEGFKQKMIDQGIPPPDHHYTTGLDGDLKAYNPATGQPVYRGGLPSQISRPSDFGFQGEGRGQAMGFVGDTSPELSPEERGPNPIVEKAKKNLEEFGSAKPPPTGTYAPPLAQPSKAPTPTSPIPGVATPDEVRKRLQGVVPSTTPPASVGTALDPEVNPHPVTGTPLPIPSPLRMTPSTVQGDISGAGGYVPPKDEVPEIAQAAGDTVKKAVDKKKVEEDLSDFAKTMQGVKAPPRPQAPGVGTPSVRSPTSIQPALGNLLALAGAARPNPVQQSLMKLLGRA